MDDGRLQQLLVQLPMGHRHPGAAAPTSPSTDQRCPGPWRRLGSAGAAAGCGWGLTQTHRLPAAALVGDHPAGMGNMTGLGSWPGSWLQPLLDACGGSGWSGWVMGMGWLDLPSGWLLQGSPAAAAGAAAAAGSAGGGDGHVFGVGACVDY